MWFKLVTVLILLVIASSGNARPRDPDPLDSSNSQEIAAETVEAVNRSIIVDSRQDQHRELKDIQNMDQSLRTVATQLLNVTAKNKDVRIPDEKVLKIETPIQTVHISTRVEDVVSKFSNEKGDDSTKMKFGIPVNSKFGHFEISNPGHAMAMTEEEIEKEMASTVTSAHKHRPTTTSMLSTWIQLYPPSTTTEENNVSDFKIDNQNSQIYSTFSTKLPSTGLKLSTTYTKPIRTTEMKQTIISHTEPSILTTKIPKNTSSIDITNYIKLSTTMSSISVENNINENDLTEKKSQNQQNQRTIPSVRPTIKSTMPTKKFSSKSSTTLKPKITTSKNSVTKPIKANSTINRLKAISTRKPNKNDTVTSTSKIEKVTLKPAIFVSQNHSSTTDKPLFITKIKTFALTDVQKFTTIPTMKPINSILSKANFSNTDSANPKVPNPTQVNNILKVHLKKPIDESTKIEIDPIRVNPPILTIEKIDDTSSYQKTNNENQDILENSKIDVKFEFNPEYTNVKLQTQPTESSSIVMPLTTTKRPRLSQKRKKNKNRHRKPSSTSTSTTVTLSTSPSDNDNLLSLDAVNNGNNANRDKSQLISIQESKIEPESKVSPSKKKKPNQQVQKPIGTQIYNFLSREVMPSVGVMSLVGLGLGLASYFLYPFGGVITRRNYDIEPNYKYNLEEYGGNYGLSEEEVLSKVYSGMTDSQHHEAKYNSISTSEKTPAFYRYTGAEQLQQRPARYPIHTVKNIANRVIYKPVETTSYDINFRNTEFKYPDVPTTPNYYERQRQQQLSTDFVSTVTKVGIGKNRQFVVGNVPKEYSSREIDKALNMIKPQDKIDNNMQYQTNEKYIEDNSSAIPLTAPVLKPLNDQATLLPKIEKEQPTEFYEEIEITPTAVAVEHGPRLLTSFDDILKVEKMNSKLSRKRRSIFTKITETYVPTIIPSFESSKIQRSSVIQVIPSKSEIEKENKIQEREEDLSNEILNIIDDALPEASNHKKKNYNKKNDTTVKIMEKKEYTKITDNLVNVLTKGTIINHDILIANNSDKLSTVIDNTITSNTMKNTKQPESIIVTSTLLTTITPPQELSELDSVDKNSSTESQDNSTTIDKPKPNHVKGIDIIGIAKRIAEIKLRLGLTILKHASEGFARYIEHIQKRFNGDE